MKKITDKNGKQHKLITHKIDNSGLFISIFNLSKIYSSIHDDIPKEIADEFLDIIEKLEKEVGYIKFSEITNIFIIEQGYNFD